MSTNSKFNHDLRNCLISLETIALNLRDGLYKSDDAVASLLKLKEELAEVLESNLEVNNNEKK